MTIVRFETLPNETEEEVKQRLIDWYNSLSPERKEKLFNISPQPMSISYEVKYEEALTEKTWRHYL